MFCEAAAGREGEERGRRGEGVDWELVRKEEERFVCVYLEIKSRVTTPGRAAVICGNTQNPDEAVF